MTSYLDTVRKITTSFMIIWITILLTFSRERLLDVLFQQWGFLIFLSITLYLFLDEGCSVPVAFHFLSHFPFSLNYIVSEIRKLELHAPFKNRGKIFLGFVCFLFFFIAFLRYLNFLYNIFLAMIFSSNSIKFSLDIFSTLVSENHHICI